MWLILLLLPAFIFITDFVRFALGARKYTITFWILGFYWYLVWRWHPEKYARAIEEELEQ